MVISQNDIDELLNNALEVPDEGDESTNTDKVRDDKVYKAPRIEAKRINFPYMSPIVKSRNIVYNPNNGTDEFAVTDKVIVRSLNNYMEYIAKKEQVG